MDTTLDRTLDRMKQGISSAIVTRYLGATEHRPARVVAELAGSGRRPRVVVSWDENLDTFENHAAAAAALVEKQGWDVRLFPGGLETGYVFVMV